VQRGLPLQAQLPQLPLPHKGRSAPPPGSRRRAAPSFWSATRRASPRTPAWASPGRPARPAERAPARQRRIGNAPLGSGPHPDGAGGRRRRATGLSAGQPRPARREAGGRGVAGGGAPAAGSSPAARPAVGGRRVRRWAARGGARLGSAAGGLRHPRGGACGRHKGGGKATDLAGSAEAGRGRREGPSTPPDAGPAPRTGPLVGCA
jgi:translation initiation factor IF-2